MIKNDLFAKNDVGKASISVRLPRSFTTALLVSLFSLAFIVTPYWNLPGKSNIELIIRDGTILLGIAWGIFAASEVQFRLKKSTLALFGLLGVIIFFINFLPLTSVLPWRGDEDRHIQKTLEILFHFPWQVMVIFVIFWCGFLYLSWRKPKFAWVIGAFLLFFAIIGSLKFTNIEYTRDLVRYPYVSYWFYAFLINVLIPFIDHPFYEIIYRIVPLFSVVVLAWTFQYELMEKGKFPALLWGVAVAIIPTVFYYTSILYLEMPVVWLMTAVCLRIEKLLTANVEQLKYEPAWYALLTIGFIKETTLPFIMIFVMFRIISMIYSKAGIKQNQETGADLPAKKTTFTDFDFLKKEAGVFFVLLLPIVYYFILRVNFNPREYQLSIQNIIDPTIYPVILRAIIEQTGAWFILFIAGCVLLVIKKKYLVLLFYLAQFFGFVLFFGLDQKIYIGYSRFYLFLLPPILAASHFLIRFIIEKKRLISYFLLVLVLAVSLLLSPIQVDGTKKPYWGNYLFDTSEHYYPVDDAFAWLKENDADNSVLMAGIYYRYFHHFYFVKLDWFPDLFEQLISEPQNDDQVNLGLALEQAEKKGYQNILFFVQGDEIPIVSEGNMYSQKEIFKNMSHIIVLFSRNN